MPRAMGQEGMERDLGGEHEARKQKTCMKLGRRGLSTCNQGIDASSIGAELESRPFSSVRSLRKPAAKEERAEGIDWLGKSFSTTRTLHRSSCHAARQSCSEQKTGSCEACNDTNRAE